MHHRWSLLPVGLALLLAGAPPANAETIVLDADHVTDWVRVPATSGWKYRDACLVPDALLELDLDFHRPVVQILDARLQLFVEKSIVGTQIDLWHVEVDGWSYGTETPDALRLWPAGHLIGTVATVDTGQISVDVTDHVREEMMATGNGVLSVKLTPVGGSGGPTPRIASPLVLVPYMRPRLVVQFSGPPGIPPTPDLAVSTADLRLVPARPAPGQPATLQAWVRNLGPGPATNVDVAFWDGAPGSGTPIGVAVVPEIAPGGGTAAASVPWTAPRGLREIHVVVDPNGAIAETDESNNSDFREFQVSDLEGPPGVQTIIESFESPGLGAWHTDYEVPRHHDGFGMKSFYLERSGAEAYHGHHAMELYLDGTGDDGTVWLETALPVDPHTTVDVNVDFELFRYAPDMAFFPVVAIGVLDPEVEGDFTIVSGGPQQGWALYSARGAVQTGPYDRVRVGVGVTVSWETAGILYLDLIRVQATQSATGLAPAPEPASLRLGQSFPNPMGPLTTITYALPEAGRVRLRIYDPAGRLIATLRDQPEPAGWHEAHWDGTDTSGRPVPSGVYLYRLDHAGRSESRKLLLAR